MQVKTLVLSIVLLFGCVEGLWAQLQAGFTIDGLPGASMGVAAATGSSYNICQGTQLYLYNNAVNADSVCYSAQNATFGFGSDVCDFSNSVSNPVFVTFNNAGQATITQNAIAKGKKSTITVTFTVSNVFPTANFTIPALQCGSNTFNFINTSTAGAGATITSYLWQFPPSGSSTTSSTAKNPSIVFDQAIGNGTGNYDVNLIVTNNFGCSNIIGQNVQVTQIPDVTVGTDNATQTVYENQTVFTFCNGLVSDTFDFNNASATINTNTGYSIKWGNPAGNVFDSSAWAGTKRIVYGQGFDTMTVSVTGADGCKNTKQFGVYVGQQPGSGLNSPQGKTVFCIGSSIPFAFTQSDSSNPAGTSYEISIRENPLFDTIIYQADILKNWPYYFVHTFNQSSCGVNDPRGSDPNAFAVNINAINACASALNGPGTIHISAKPVVKIQGPQIICNNDTATYTNNSTWDGVYPYCSSITPPDAEQVWVITPPLGGSYKILSNAGSLSPYISGDKAINVAFYTNGTYGIRLYIRSNNTNAADCVTGDSTNFIDFYVCVRNAPYAKFTLDKKSACVPYTFTASQMADTTISCAGDSVTWTVDTLANCTAPAGSVGIDTGTSSSKARITFPQPGQYLITLSVASTGGGCTSYYYDTVTVYKQAIVSLDTSIGSICSGGNILPQVTVDSCFSDGPLSCKWIFTGGSPDTAYGLTPPTVTYNSPSLPGRDTVRLLVTNGCGTVHDTAYVTVISKPVVDAIHNKSICSGDSAGLTLNSPDGNIVYSWISKPVSGTVSGASSGVGLTIPDVLTSTSRAVVEYDIWDSLAGGSCISDTMKVLVTVSPVVKAVAGPDQFLCKNVTSATLAATPPATGSGTWTIVSPLPSPAVVTNKNSATSTVTGLLADTLYSLVWTISNTGSQCVDSTDTVIISTRPIINIVDTQATICPGQQPVVIQGQNPTGGDSTSYTFLWQASGDGPNFTDTTGGTLDSLILSPIFSNRYYRRIVSSASCSDTSNTVKLIVVTEVPQPSFTPHDTSACAAPGGSLPVTFTNTTPDENKFSYQWVFGNGGTSQLANPGAQNFSTTSSGYGDTTYYITLTATNGCVPVTFTDSVKVKSQPAVLFSADKSIGCSSGPVTFTNLSVIPGNPTVYTWYFGDGDSDITNNNTVPHVYHNGPATTYFVTLTGSNDCGIHTSQPLSITVDSNHIGLYVNINSTERYICAGDTVHFQNKSSGATLFTWNFGDSSPAITTTNGVETITHQYANAGAYYVSICASNYCTDTCTYDTINVGGRPSASFTATPDTLCAGQTVQFNNTSTPAGDPGVIFTWNFGDGSAASHDISPGHVYTSGGTDTAWLVAARQFSPGFPPGFGCPDSAFAIIAVDQPEGTLTYNDSLCPGQTVTFTATSNNAIQYNFSFGDFTSQTNTNNVVTHTYSRAGVYLPSVTLTGFSGKCFNTITGADSIRVDSIQAAFKFDSIPACDSTKLIFTDSSFAYFGIKAYQWQINGNTYATNPATYTFTQTGTYPVSLMVTGLTGCTSQTQTLQLPVYVHQTPSGTVAINSDTCARDSVYFSASVFSNDPVQYIWDFSNGDRQNGQNVATVFNPPGMYNTRLIAQSSFGCADTIYRALTVKTTPQLTITPIDTIRLCRGDTLQLNATGDSIVTWGWSPSNGLSCVSCGNPSVSPTVTTLYTVTGTNSSGCSANDSVAVNVVQPFTVSATPASTSICLPDTLQQIQFFATGAYGYTWSPATWLNSNTVFNPVVTIPQNALQTSTTVTYSVTGYDQYHCFTDTQSVTLNIGLTPTINFGAGDSGIAGRKDTLFPITATNGPFTSFTWSVSGPGVINPMTTLGDTVQLTVNGDITVYVTAVNNYGCSVTDTLYFSAFCNQGEQVYIPNAFSPDGDGINDVFMVEGRGIIVESFKIFNRWGQQVFDGGSNFAPGVPAFGWDGTIHGKPATEDVYVYIAKLRCTASSISYFQKGNVTLIRVRR